VCHFEWRWVILNDLSIFNDTKHRAVSLRQLNVLLMHDTLMSTASVTLFQVTPVDRLHEGAKVFSCSSCRSTSHSAATRTLLNWCRKTRERIHPGGLAEASMSQRHRWTALGDIMTRHLQRFAAERGVTFLLLRSRNNFTYSGTCLRLLFKYAFTCATQSAETR